jgi:hypothetical protein
MKIVRTVISIVFVVGTIALIVYDAQSDQPDKKEKALVKQDSSKADSAHLKSVNK